MANEETPTGEAGAELTQGLEQVAQAAGQVAEVTRSASSGGNNLEYILDVSLQISVEVGRSKMTVQDLLQLGQGSVVELHKLAGEPLDVFINGKHVARGEAVIVNEKFGVRLTEIISPQARIESLA
ncbi:MAG: flagellar motor switch protein FliN [Oligoflexia bacterium]|nr:flagellar motor switch protein FliN [Oligoflexia bacterium]